MLHLCHARVVDLDVLALDGGVCVREEAREGAEARTASELVPVTAATLCILGAGISCHFLVFRG